MCVYLSRRLCVWLFQLYIWKISHCGPFKTKSSHRGTATDYRASHCECSTHIRDAEVASNVGCGAHLGDDLTPMNHGLFAFFSGFVEDCVWIFPLVNPNLFHLWEPWNVNPSNSFGRQFRIEWILIWVISGQNLAQEVLGLCACFVSMSWWIRLCPSETSVVWRCFPLRLLWSRVGRKMPILGMVINPWVGIETVTCFDHGTNGHDWPLDSHSILNPEGLTIFCVILPCLFRPGFGKITDVSVKTFEFLGWGHFLIIWEWGNWKARSLKYVE